MTGCTSRKRRYCISYASTWIRGDEVKRVGIVLQYLLFLHPLFDQYVFTITAVFLQ